MERSPPDGPPSRRVPGFELVEAERTPTFTLFRYEAARPTPVSTAELAAPGSPTSSPASCSSVRARSRGRASLVDVSTGKIEVSEAPPATARPPVEPQLRSDRTIVIKPSSRWPHLDISELWHYRELLQTLVWRDVVVRYKQTFLGVAWAILAVFTATVYVIVFGKFANFPAGEVPYPSLVIAGVRRCSTSRRRSPDRA